MSWVDAAGKLIETTNFWWFGICLVGWVRCFYWKRGATDQTREIIGNLQFMLAGSGLNHGWFALSRHLRDGEGFWNEAMFDLRVFAVLFTFALFFYGAARFMEHIRGVSLTRSMIVTAAIGVIAALVGFF